MIAGGKSRIPASTAKSIKNYNYILIAPGNNGYAISDG
jgi:hypothetical protein